MYLNPEALYEHWIITCHSEWSLKLDTVNVMRIKEPTEIHSTD